VKYVEAHKNELEKFSAVLVHDTGTGRVLKLGCTTTIKTANWWTRC